MAQYAEFGLVNEQKLALVFVREVGAIDNATYRQLDSSIAHARARLEIHKLCDLGFLEKKGQGRNTYYISNHGKTKSARIQKRNVFSTDKNEM